MAQKMYVDVNEIMKDCEADLASRSCFVIISVSPASSAFLSSFSWGSGIYLMVREAIQRKKSMWIPSKS